MFGRDHNKHLSRVRCSFEMKGLQLINDVAMKSPRSFLHPPFLVHHRHQRDRPGFFHRSEPIKEEANHPWHSWSLLSGLIYWGLVIFHVYSWLLKLWDFSAIWELVSSIALPIENVVVHNIMIIIGNPICKIHFLGRKVSPASSRFNYLCSKKPIYYHFSIKTCPRMHAHGPNLSPTRNQYIVGTSTHPLIELRYGNGCLLFHFLCGVYIILILRGFLPENYETLRSLRLVSLFPGVNSGNCTW